MFVSNVIIHTIYLEYLFIIINVFGSERFNQFWALFRVCEKQNKSIYISIRARCLSLCDNDSVYSWDNNNTIREKKRWHQRRDYLRGQERTILIYFTSTYF